MLGGDFFGWQFVLYGGFSSAIVAVIFSGVFYWLYAGAITELAARYRTSGGAFDFVKMALGKRSAAIMAILGLLKLILANSALALAISSYIVQAGMSTKYQILCWIITYGAFTVLDSVGVRQSATAQFLATALCVIILVFWAFSCLTKFNMASIRSEGYETNGAEGFFMGLPFALQFFDGFEEVPLLMGYAQDPERTIPRAVLISYLSVAVIAVMVLISGAGITDAAVLLDSEAPLMNGVDSVYGDGSFVSDATAYLVVLGLVVNFFAFVIFASQQIQAVAAAGQLPAILAYRHPVHGSPIAASVCASTVGVLLCAGFTFVLGSDAAQNTLVTAALMPAVLGYALLLECIVRVRKIEHGKHSVKDSLSPRDAERLGFDPGALRFVYGTWGARLAQIMCVVFACALLVLASVKDDFLYGLISLAFIALFMYGFMFYYMRRYGDLVILVDDHPHQQMSSEHGGVGKDDSDLADNGGEGHADESSSYSPLSWIKSHGSNRKVENVHASL